jgi:DNA-directed RNA polymerase specialized sigma24 family protein
LATTPESFEALLAWLDPDDREVAGQKYEVIRSGLIRIFVSKGFSDAEHLADETIERVSSRLSDIRGDYVGEKAKYFHGVARNIILEERRRKEVATEEFPFRWDEVTKTSDEHECLKRCLKFLPRAKRELILDYHVYEGHDKIEIHKEMAHELAITEIALRGRAHHIRANLEKCVLQCVQNLRQKTQKPSSNPLQTAVPLSGERHHR